MAAERGTRRQAQLPRPRSVTPTLTTLPPTLSLTPTLTLTLTLTFTNRLIYLDLGANSPSSSIRPFRELYPDGASFAVTAFEADPAWFQP